MPTPTPHKARYTPSHRPKSQDLPRAYRHSMGKDSLMRPLLKQRELRVRILRRSVLSPPPPSQPRTGYSSNTDVGDDFERIEVRREVSSSTFSKSRLPHPRIFLQTIDMHDAKTLWQTLRSPHREPHMDAPGKTWNQAPPPDSPTTQRLLDDFYASCSNASKTSTPFPLHHEPIPLSSLHPRRSRQTLKASGRTLPPRRRDIGLSTCQEENSDFWNQQNVEEEEEEPEEEEEYDEEEEEYEEDKGYEDETDDLPPDRSHDFIVRSGTPRIFEYLGTLLPFQISSYSSPQQHKPASNKVKSSSHTAQREIWSPALLDELLPAYHAFAQNWNPTGKPGPIPKKTNGKPARSSIASLVIQPRNKADLLIPSPLLRSCSSKDALTEPVSKMECDAALFLKHHAYKQHDKAQHHLKEALQNLDQDARYSDLWDRVIDLISSPTSDTLPWYQDIPLVKELCEASGDAVPRFIPTSLPLSLKNSPIIVRCKASTDVEIYVSGSKTSSKTKFDATPSDGNVATSKHSSAKSSSPLLAPSREKISGAQKSPFLLKKPTALCCDAALLCS